MLFSKALLATMATAFLTSVKAEDEIDTTIVSTITITVTLYTPEESASIEAARIQSEADAAASLAAKQALVEEYYATLDSSDKQQQTQEPNNRNVYLNATSGFASVTETETLALDSYITEDSETLNVTDSVTSTSVVVIAATQGSSEDAAAGVAAYYPGVFAAGAVALAAAFL
ncbi:uncharacterized protein LODBEIA_P09950 [Lodderomyces beijingensis]|uniref:Uncharacterized protein n=1 Tax=Lodderomyces beijingensis TaxID=1775926 RepID=A0ABP0ZI37_9ASCO